MNSTVDRYAVFGNPVAQSKSPEIHRRLAEATDQVMHYDKQCIALDGFKDAVECFFAEGGKGLNITVPFKEEAFAYADRLSERARRAGAANFLMRDTQGHVFGDNTDGKGLVDDLQRLGWQLKDSRILVLGAGGAVRGVLYPLLQEGPAEICIANRTLSRAEQLVEKFSPFGAVSARPFYLEREEAFDLIINGTSASLNGQLPELNPRCIAGHSKAYDMVYGTETPFMLWARQQGCAAVADGSGMLIGQALESFVLWRQVAMTFARAVTILSPIFSNSRQ